MLVPCTRVELGIILLVKLNGKKPWTVTLFLLRAKGLVQLTPQLISLDIKVENSNVETQTGFLGRQN